MRETSGVTSKRRETNDFFAAFSHQAPIEQKEIPNTTVDITLWESNVPYFDIFYLLQNYLREYYAMDTYLLYKIIKERQLPLEQSLSFISDIHHGYVEIMFEADEKERELELKNSEIDKKE